MELNRASVDQHLSGISVIIGLASLGPIKSLQCDLVIKSPGIYVFTYLFIFL